MKGLISNGVFQHIACSLSNQNDWPSFGNIGQFFYILLMVALVALLAFYSTKMLALAKRGGGRLKNRNLEVLESMGIGAQAMVHVVRAGDRFFLIGATKEQVTMLAELDQAQLLRPETVSFSFDSILQRFMKK